MSAAPGGADLGNAASSVLASPLWYRVAGLRPRLAAQARLHRHHYRGQLWFLLHDPASGRVHRFTPAARLVIAAMDGQRSVAALWQRARQHLGEDAPTQDELLALLGQLHGADLLATDVQPDVLELLTRGERQRSQQRQQAWRNPLALRLRLWDPGRWLDRHAGLWRWLWGAPGALLWMALVLPALLLLPAAWPALSGNLADRVLQPDNLLLLALVFPLLKALHELGHASATHARGGEVHDMGLMLLLGMPVPYVDASAANVLRSRWSRALVGAAGMAVELALAAAAFLLWRLLEPGLARALCFNVMLAAGVATLLFNGNPLLRYDAYYILADLAELPNLGQRASRLWIALLQRHLLRMPDVEAPPESRRERWWLMAYGVASNVYRVAITLLLALFVGSRFFFIGVLLAVWALGQLVLPPLRQAWRALHQRPTLVARRGQVLAGGAALLSLLGLAAATVPLPQRSLVDGVVWLPEAATLRATGPGVVAELLAQPGAAVATGTLLMRRSDAALQADLQRQTARVAELQAQHTAQWVHDRAVAELTQQQWQFERTVLASLQTRVDGLLVHSPVAGIFTLERPADLLGRHHAAGATLGHVLDPTAAPRVRVLVNQADADVAGPELRQVALRLLADPGTVLPARVLRRVPAGTDAAPHHALLAGRGSGLSPDPRDPEGLKLLSRAFELELEPLQPWTAVAPSAGGPAFGQLVRVRFDLAPQPLTTQTWRGLRRLFLSHFSQ